jgi:acyl CoA:acetate/3-ketoacid CoA transferase beta subunit
MNVPAIWDSTGNIGGSMDLATGAKKLFIEMEHTTTNGSPKIVRDPTYPGTARKKAHKIFADLAVIEVIPEGLR